MTASPPEPPPPLPPEVDDDDWRCKVKLDHLEDKSLIPHIMAMLSKHSPMWQKGRLGKIDITEHRIELLPGTKPIRQAPYRQGPHKRKETEKAIKEMLDAGVIEPANCEWASPVVLAPKPDGTQRFCVDYRKLNAATVADWYPLPRADDCLDSLGAAMVFTTLDCNSGYWQLALAEEDKDKTAFVSHMGTCSTPLGSVSRWCTQQNSSVVERPTKGKKKRKRGDSGCAHVGAGHVLVSTGPTW